jgi:hypothetical protein
MMMTIVRRVPRAETASEARLVQPMASHELALSFTPSGWIGVVQFGIDALEEIGPCTRGVGQAPPCLTPSYRELSDLPTNRF